LWPRIPALAVLGLFMSGVSLGRSEAPSPVAQVVPAAAWGDLAGGLRVSAWAPEDRFPVGQGCVIVAVQNVSKDRVAYELLARDENVSGSDGDVPLTRLGLRRAGLDPKHPRSGSTIVDSLASTSETYGTAYLTGPCLGCTSSFRNRI
jgi:hypothetical protein